ncbi:MAG: HEAT repeat domain-containing protein [Myxococcaceae bacterium]|nr:HEAT repeat domain-containing protein [Myxococcaceae bacterium]
MDPIKRIVELLDDQTPRKRIAAAVVLGELKVKDPAVVARLTAMAKDELDAYAEAAIEALGQVQALKALPVLLDSLNRSRDVQAAARAAIANLGEAALPELKARLADATPEARAILSQLLPAVGGKQSFELALEGLRGQPFDAINKVTLSVRQEAREMSEAQRRVMKTQALKFLEKKKTLEDEDATRGALKILGFLELPETQDDLIGFLSNKHSPLVRMEAATAMRFACAKGPSKKALRKLMDLLQDENVHVARGARDSLTVLKIGVEFADELAELCEAKDASVALWAIAHLGELAVSQKGAAGKLAAKTLLPVARSKDRARSEAAAKVVVALDGGEALLAEALADAEEEAGAQVLTDILSPLAHKLSKKDLKRLLDAGGKNLADALAVARRQLEPVRAVDPQAWAELLRDKAKSLGKRDPARAEAISQMLAHSVVATPDDRFAAVVQQLVHHSLDPHPRARQRDPSLAEIEKLHSEGYQIAEAVMKAKALSDEARYYVGVHFAEKPQFELKNVGAEVLEKLAAGGKGKMAKAAKNKMKLLEL